MKNIIYSIDKSSENYDRHGIDFNYGIRVLNDSDAITITYDNGKRKTIIGQILFNFISLFIKLKDKDTDTGEITSARFSNDKEKSLYYKITGKNN